MNKVWISLLVIIFIVSSLSGCIEDKDESPYFDYVINFNIKHILVLDSEIIHKESTYILIEVINGKCYNGTPIVDITGLIFKINGPFEGIFQPTAYKKEDKKLTEIIEVGDHFSIFIKRTLNQGSTMDNLSVWDESGIKFNFQKHTESIKMTPDLEISVNHYDTLNTPFLINESTIIDIGSDWKLVNKSKDAYWLPYIDEVIEMDESEYKNCGLYHIKTSFKEQFYYDSYLEFDINGTKILLNGSDDSKELESNGYTFEFISELLYRETWLEFFTSSLRGDPRDVNSFYIIRR